MRAAMEHVGTRKFGGMTLPTCAHTHDTIPVQTRVPRVPRNEVNDLARVPMRVPNVFHVFRLIVRTSHRTVCRDMDLGAPALAASRDGRDSLLPAFCRLV